MEKKNYRFVLAAFFLWLLLFPIQAFAFDSNAASDYAFKWHNDYHPDYHNYVDQPYDEDANFVSHINWWGL